MMGRMRGQPAGETSDVGVPAHARTEPDGPGQAFADVLRRWARTPVPRDRTAPQPSRWPVAILAVVAFGAYLLLSLTRWWRAETPSWDLAIFEQAIRGYANLGAPIVDIKGPGYHQLGDHFSPLLALVAPVYRLFPGPVTLLVVQCALVAVSVVPLTLVARRILGAWAGLGVGVAYAFSWGIQSAVDVQFHEYALAAPILAFGLAAALEARWRTACVWILLLLGVKEDLGLSVAAFGVVLWLWGVRRAGTAMVAAGALGMAFVLFVAVPFFNPHGRYDYWGKLGDDDAAAGSGSLLASVGDALVGIVQPADVKLQTIVMLLVVTAFVAVRSPLVLMLVPTLLWRFAGSNHYYWGTTWHYSIILMPVVFAALIDGLRLLRDSERDWARSAARAVPAVVVVVAAALTTQYPLGDLARPETYVVGARAAAVERALAVIPPGASVATDTGLIVQLAQDRTVYWVTTDPTVRPDYVAIYTASGWGPDAPTDVARYAEQLFPGTDYTTAHDADGFLIARRTHPAIGLP
jgi:uncharacterized membrane protein